MLVHICLRFWTKLKTTRCSLNERRSSAESFCRKKRSAPILYYSNHSARFQLLISGDVETNPGPTTCGICERTVRKNSHQMNILNASSKLTVNVSPLSIVKFHCFQFGFLENYVCNKQKKSMKDQRSFSFDAILKVFANLDSVHSKIWCSRFSNGTMIYFFSFPLLAIFPKMKNVYIWQLQWSAIRKW